MPAHTKDPSVRARRNKSTTRATLKKPVNPKIPAMPKGLRWRPQVSEWWKRAWSSPMRSEWDDADVDMLYLALKLMNAFWDPETSPREAKQLAGEIRLILTQCGFSPMARRSLQWELPKDDESPASKSAKAPAKKAASKKVADPRERFRVVKGGAAS